MRAAAHNKKRDAVPPELLEFADALGDLLAAALLRDIEAERAQRHSDIKGRNAKQAEAATPEKTKRPRRSSRAT